MCHQTLAIQDTGGVTMGGRIGGRAYQTTSYDQTIRNSMRPAFLVLPWDSTDIGGVRGEGGGAIRSSHTLGDKTVRWLSTCMYIRVCFVCAHPIDSYTVLLVPSVKPLYYC